MAANDVIKQQTNFRINTWLQPKRYIVDQQVGNDDAYLLQLSF